MIPEMAVLMFYTKLIGGIAILGEIIVYYANSQTKIKSRAKVIKCQKKSE